MISYSVKQIVIVERKKFIKKQDEKWHKINIVIDFNSQAYTLKSGETKELKLSWENGYGKLASGTYRIIKGTDYEKEEGNSKSFNIAIEFTIE